MKNTLKITGILSVVLILSLSMIAQPQGRMRGKQQFARQPQRGGILSILKFHQEELKITDEQLKQIEGLMDSHMEEMIKVKSEGQLQALGLRKLMQDRDNRDYAKIKEALAKASTFRNDQIIDRMQHQEKLMNVLTLEQKEALKSLQKDRFQRGQRFMQGRRGNMHRGFSRGMNRGFKRSNTRGMRFHRAPIKKDVIIK